MKVIIGAKIFKPNGMLVKECPFQEAHSFVGNFIKTLYVLMSGLTITFNDTGNTPRSVAPNAANILVAGAANATGSGILIGSGTTTPTLSDIALGTQITANVYHMATSLFMNSPSLSSMELIITRAFLNNTGSALTINEVGLVAATSGYYFLQDRTLYTVVVPIGLSICFTYKIGISL